MVLQDRMNLILIDPEVYTEYYKMKYNATKETIDKIIAKDAPVMALLHLRVVLAEMIAKYAISFAACIKIESLRNTDALIRDYIKIEKARETAEDSLDNIKAFEDLADEIQKKYLPQD